VNDLIEIFKDHTPTVKGKSNRGQYEAEYIVTKRSDAKRVELQDLIDYVARLNEKYPEEFFYIKAMRRVQDFGDKKLYMLTKENEEKRVPIIFDLEEQRFYIRRQDLETNPQLANYIIMRTLGALGVSQSRYLSTRVVAS